MTQTLKRALKCRCTNLVKVRHELLAMGIKLDRSIEQVDYMFHLMNTTTGKASLRLKLRYENGLPQCIYLYDRDQQHATDDPHVEYQYYEIQEHHYKSLLMKLYDIHVIVRKQREVWKVEDLLIHLDQVERIGDIMEIEVLEGDRAHALEGVMKAVRPYAGEEIVGSNEDLL